MTENDLKKAVLDSFKAYKKYGARSSKKLLSLHGFLGKWVQQAFGDDYTVHFDTGNNNNKEIIVEGQYYPKRIDITVTKADKSIFCLGVKFVTSNFAQNANNYFENMMGETANIQSNSVPYAHVIILRDNAPYYDKDGNIKKIETITESHLKKYLKLVTDRINPHNPSAICIFGVDISETGTSPEITHIDLGKKFTNKTHGAAFHQKTSLATLQTAMNDAKTQCEV